MKWDLVLLIIEPVRVSKESDSGLEKGYYLTEDNWALKAFTVIFPGVKVCVYLRER
jgi:hypothetical protein